VKKEREGERGERVREREREEGREGGRELVKFEKKKSERICFTFLFFSVPLCIARPLGVASVSPPLR